MVCLQSHFSSLTERFCHALIFLSLRFHTPLSRRVIFVACDDWCLETISACERAIT
jgi:hypothetical protein